MYCIDTTCYTVEKHFGYDVILNKNRKIYRQMLEDFNYVDTNRDL